MYIFMKKSLFMAVSMLSMSALLVGCSGSDGATGATGAAGANGLAGADGPGGAAGATGAPGAAGADGATLFKAANKNVAFSSIAVSTVAGLPTVNFTLNSGTAPVTGVAKSNLRFYLAESIPGAAASDSPQWNQWLQERDRAGTPFGTFTDLGAGRYQYTFMTPFASAPSQTNVQRLIVRITGLTGYNSVNGDYDFTISAPGTRLVSVKDVVTSAACNECHGSNINNYGHGGGYTETKTCVICHNNSASMTAAGFDFVTMIHQIHSKINAKAVFTAYTAKAMDWSAVKYPGNVLDCTKCHKGTLGANWNTKPTGTACKSCHTALTFDGISYTGIKGTLKSGHYAQTTDASCSACHNTGNITSKHPLPSSYVAALRTMNATFSAVTVDTVTGKVTATFTVSDNGVAVTDSTKFVAPTFMLVKLVRDSAGVLNWVGYTNQYNTKVDAVPVFQTKGEKNGTLVSNANGSFSYTFKLITAEPEGDINNVNHAHNIGTPAGSIYNSVTGNASYLAAAPILYPSGKIAFEPTRTHRVAMTSSKFYAAGTAPATGAPGFNAWLDFVPNGNAVTETREIVKMSDCAGCHANKKLHAAFDIEVCVTCHNPGTKDPYTGETVSIENIIHKLHMGKKLPSVIAGGTYMINGAGHNYSAASFPQTITNCLACHNESNADGANWRTKPSSSACITCHNSSGALAHGAQNSTTAGESCTVCHAAGKLAPVTSVH